MAVIWVCFISVISINNTDHSLVEGHIYIYIYTYIYMTLHRWWWLCSNIRDLFAVSVCFDCHRLGSVVIESVKLSSNARGFWWGTNSCAKMPPSKNIHYLFNEYSLSLQWSNKNAAKKEYFYNQLQSHFNNLNYENCTPSPSGGCILPIRSSTIMCPSRHRRTALQYSSMKSCR